VIEENIDSVAEVFAAVWCSLLCAPWLTLRGTYVTIGSVVIWQLIAARSLCRAAALRILFFWVPVTYTVCLFRPLYLPIIKNFSQKICTQQSLMDIIS
jgi:hypothetical protein